MQRSFRERLALARGHMQRGDLAGAEALFSSLVGEHPGFADVHNELGLLYHHLGDFDRARDAFRRALALNPNYTEAALNLAITCNDLGRYEEAQAACERARDQRFAAAEGMDPAVPSRVANLHAQIGETWAEAGRWQLAAHAFEEALALRPAYHDIRLRLAETLESGGDHDGALRELERVVAESPDLLDARMALGMAHFRAGARDRAVEQWRAVLARAPGHRRAVLYLRLAGDERRTGS